MKTAFHDTPRTPCAPFDKRVGDDRLIRDKRGNVIKMFGYYTPYQVAARKRWGEDAASAVQKTMLRRILGVQRQPEPTRRIEYTRNMQP